MTNKEKYRQLCLEEDSIPVFSQDWWMDATSLAGNWDVAIYEENGQIVGTWCYFYKKKWGFNIVTTPLLTKYQGIWFRDSQLDLIQNKVITRELLKQLPVFSSFAQFFSPKYNNWLPLYWEGFKQTTNYTFLIDDISNHEKVFENFAAFRRRDINKAKKYFNVEIGFDGETFYELRKKNLAQLNDIIGYQKHEFVNLVNACIEKNAGEFLVCKNAEGQIACYTFVVWDKLFTYYLISGFEPELCKKGASDLLMSETIKFAGTKTKSFDFEGSMDKGIAHNLQSFAEKQVPYYIVSKDNLLFKIFNLIKNKR